MAGDMAAEDDPPENSRLAELRKLQEELISRVEMRDTREAEQIAIRSNRTLEAEDSVRDALRLSIEARVIGLMEYESRAAKEAAKKPQMFLTWRDDFYDSFRSKLTEALRPFAPAADKLGFVFDAGAIAGDYVNDSTMDLEPLSDLGCSELEGGVLRLTETWADRPKRIANRIIPERKALCPV